MSRYVQHVWFLRKLISKSQFDSRFRSKVFVLFIYYFWTRWAHFSSFLQCKTGIFYKMVARLGKCPKNHFFCIFGLLSYKYNLHQVRLEFRQLFDILVHPTDDAPRKKPQLHLRTTPSLVEIQTSPLVSPIAPRTLATPSSVEINTSFKAGTAFSRFAFVTSLANTNVAFKEKKGDSRIQWLGSLWCTAVTWILT